MEPRERNNPHLKIRDQRSSPEDFGMGGGVDVPEMLTFNNI